MKKGESSHGLERNFSLGFSLLTLSGGLLFTFVPYTGVLSGRLPGDYGDARWTVSIHESWFLTFRGQLGWGETLFFFPFEHSKGLSDAFLPQGVIYSILRVLGQDQIDSWLMTTLLLVLLMSLSMFIIARSVFRTRIGFVLFYWAAASSFAFHASMGHVQTAGYSFAALTVACLVSNSRSKPEYRSGFLLVAAFSSLSLLALSAWYGFVFVLLLAAVSFFACIWLVGFRKAIENLLTWWSEFRFGSKAASLLVLAAGMATCSSLYISAFQSSQPREWGEYLTFAPRLLDFLNPSRSQSLWGTVLNNLGLFSEIPTGERLLGFPLALFCFFLWLFAQVFSKRLLHGRTENTDLAAVLTLGSVGLLALFTVWPSGFSFYIFLWEFIPGAQTIRAPMRATIVIIPVMLFVVFNWIDKSVSALKARPKSNGRIPVLASLIPLFLLIEQQTVVGTTWTREEFIPQQIESVSQEILELRCRAFLIEDPIGGANGYPFWRSEIDASSLATISGVPTINGYSGGAPPGYPFGTGSWSSEDTAARLRWAGLERDKLICLVNTSESGATVKTNDLEKSN